MLIYLTDKALEPGISIYTRSDLVRCLGNILQAHIEAKHLVIANIQTLAAYHQVEEIQELSETSKVALKSISREFIQNGRQLRQDISGYVQIVEPSQAKITITTQNQQTIVNIPIWYFEDSEASQKTILLCENQNDAKLFIHLVKAYITTLKAFKKVPFKIQATPRGGGGNTIKPELDAQCQSRIFCLCIVDNDCSAPGIAFGGTAKRLGLSQQKWQEWQNSSVQQPESSITIQKDSALAKTFALKEREVENLIPTELIEKSLPKSTEKETFEKIDSLKKWEKRCPKAWRKFIDLKNGLRGYDVLHWTDKEAQKCWLDFMQGIGKESLKLKNDCQDGNECNDKKRCQCILWVGLGENILSQVVEYMDKETAHKIAESFNFAEETSLNELADELLVWCCAGERIRV
jgi:hypothetical protein